MAKRYEHQTLALDAGSPQVSAQQLVDIKNGLLDNGVSPEEMETFQFGDHVAVIYLREQPVSAKDKA